MSNLPLGDDLKKLFDDVTSGRSEGSATRAILVQNDNGMLRLIDSLPEEGSDKEDFTNLLGKLFAKEPSKPGYALFRLDSKSPAGLYEWLNCAYRPEGAKVREKMQYAITQASLFQGLNEQHFLETVYGATASEFSFPTRLRNQRKHDYQNPQLPTAGKKPAEAAGTGVAGRRNFDKIPSPGALPRKSPASETASSASTAHLSSTSSTNVPEQEVSPSVESAAAVENTLAAPLPSHQVESHQEHLSKENSTLDKDGATDEVVPMTNAEDIVKVAEPKREIVSAQIDDVQTAIAEPAPLASMEALSVKDTAAKDKDEDEEEDVMNQSIAPSSIPSLQKDIVDEETIPTATTSAPISDPVVPMNNSTNTATPAGQKQATSSVGLGTGKEGLETERERNLASLKNEEEQQLRRGGNQGGSHIGFPWHADVEPALHGLAKKLAGTSEWNLVVLKIDLAKEQIELASEPRFVPPGDMSEALPKGEPCYAFYSHPDAQNGSTDSSQVAVIYICPIGSSVRQRMLYSANLATTSQRVGQMTGLSIMKRMETADPQELTADFFAEELLGKGPVDAGQAKAYARPKKPGRK